jgi:hypothetical protein
MNILEHYNTEKIKINNPINLDDDTFFCKFTYNNMPFIIKTNKICYIKKKFDNKFINISITSPDYLLWVENFYKFCIDYIHSKNEEWFEEPLTKSDIEFSFINPLKTNIKDSCFDIQSIIDENRLQITDSNDNVNSLENIEGSQVIPSFHIKGIKFNNKYFMLDIELTNLYIILDNTKIHLEENNEKTNDSPLIDNNENDNEDDATEEADNINEDLDTNNEKLEEESEEINELELPVDDLEHSNININNKNFYEVYELIDNKIKENIINNLRNIFISKKIKNNLDLFEMMEDEEEN